MIHDELLACMDELIFRLRQDCGLSIKEIEQLFDKELVRHVLDATHGNITKAARLSGTHRNALAQAMKKHGFEIKQWDRKGSRGPRNRQVHEGLIGTTSAMATATLQGNTAAVEGN